MNQEQIQAFNDNWDSTLEELTDKSKKIEYDLFEQHQLEREKFEEEMEKQEISGTKYSSDLIDKRFKFEQLLKNKKYSAAKILKEKIEQLEYFEQEEWQKRFINQKDKQRELLARKQKNESEALKTRLEKSINAKLKARMLEYDKLLQRIQNLQNELMTRQSLNLAKITNSSAKLLSKYIVSENHLYESMEGKVKRILFKRPNQLQK